MAHDRGRLGTKIGLTVAALAVAGTHVIWPALKIDLITVGLLLVAAIPWLDRLFTSLQTPLGGVEYREIEKRLDELAGETRSTRRIAETSEATELARQDVRPGADLALSILADEYDRVRAAMASGPARTAAMTGLVGRMIAAVERGESIDVGAALSSSRGGQRLAAYASLYARPDSALVLPLVDAVVEVEDKPFGQYWALRSLWRVLEAGGPDLVDRNTLRRLEALHRRLPAGSDRQYELRRILDIVR